MSYTLKLKSGKQYGLSDTEAQAMKRTLFDATKPIYLEIGEDFFRSTEVFSITRNPMTEADIPRVSALPSGPQCRGQYSIQLAISKYIKSMYHKDWQKHIADKKLREQIRLKMRENKANKWCDYKQSECACEPEFKPIEGRHRIGSLV